MVYSEAADEVLVKMAKIIIIIIIYITFYTGQYGVNVSLCDRHGGFSTFLGYETWKSVIHFCC